MKMNGKKVPVLVKVPVKYGLFGGVLAAILLATLFYIGRYPFVPVERTILFAIFIFFSLKELRDYNYGGSLYFWQGLIGGVICYMTMAITAGFLLWVWGQFSDSYLTHYVSAMTEQMTAGREELEKQVGKEAVELQLEKLPSTTIFDLAFDYVLKSMFIGIFLTIIISVILRRQPKT